MYVSAKYLHSRGELDGGGIAATVMSNLGLKRSLNGFGIEVTETDVGDKNVYGEMIKRGYQLGGEQSGHIIFRKYATTGDGVLTALKIAETVLESKCPLSCLTKGLTRYSQKTQSVRVRDKNAVLSNKQVMCAVKDAEQLLGSGRVLLRASGTEPVVRILAEAETPAVCEEAVMRVVKAVKAAEEEI